MVKLKENESFDSLMKRFKRQVETSGIIQDYKKHLEYIPPSEKKKLKKEAARKKALKKERLNRLYNKDNIL